MSHTTILHHLGDMPGEIAAALGARANITAMSQQAEDAVLIPRQTGAWSHDLRHALAARIARLHGVGDVAGDYAARCTDPALAPLADPARDGTAEGLAEVCAFIDKAAARTRDVVPGDVRALQQAGVSDADIVRLCEISAFLSFQLRTLVGLRLMAGVAP